MRIFNALRDTSIENLRYIFPTIHQDVNPTKMSPPPIPSPKPLSFLAPPPIRSKSASRTAYQIPKRNTITQTPTLKASKKAIPAPPLTKVQSKPLKKTIQNNPSNPTN